MRVSVRVAVEAMLAHRGECRLEAGASSNYSDHRNRRWGRPTWIVGSVAGTAGILAGFFFFFAFAALRKSTCLSLFRSYEKAQILRKAAQDGFFAFAFFRKSTPSRFCVFAKA